MKQELEQKQIEELEKDIAVRMAMAKGVAGSMNNGVEGWLGEYLIEKGWIKPTENAVVLTREEYEKVKHVLKYEPEEAIIRLEDLAKNERLYNPHMFCSLAGCSGVHKGCNRTCKESWIVIERKETAEKFAEMVLALFHDDMKIATITRSGILRICKEITGGERCLN